MRVNHGIDNFLLRQSENAALPSAGDDWVWDEYPPCQDVSSFAIDFNLLFIRIRYYPFTTIKDHSFISNSLSHTEKSKA